MAAKSHKGRGSASTMQGRFATTLVEFDESDPAAEKGQETQVRAMRAKSIISHNNSPDIPFDRSINPYLGCEHGCVYCYARPSHSYLDLSPGLDFETKIFYKPNAVAVLLKEWEKPSYECKPITIGANTDPYQPVEKTLQITRHLLEMFLEHRHPLSIISKGILMSRDIDLLAELAKRNLLSVAISVPTANSSLKRILEPRVPAARARFRLIEKLREAKVPVSLLMAPIIPAINDMEIESVVKRAAEAGVSHASWILLRLPNELKQIFEEWLETHMPERASHVMSLMRQASGGRHYDNRFGIRQRGKGPYAEMLDQRFRSACRRNGLSAGRKKETHDCAQFRHPGQRQMKLAFS
jgi:DNA repair photolyase